MANDKIKIKIDDLELETDKNNTILQTALENGIYIPHLCFDPELKPFGACRICMVQDEEGNLITACETRVEEGMSISTESNKINSVRRLVVKLLLANHEWNCLTCAKDSNCKLQDITAYLGINKENVENLRLEVKEISLDESNPFYTRDLQKCILCGICVRVCDEILGVNAIDFGFRGDNTKITTLMDKPIIESECISCGECVEACPVGALVPKNSYKPSREIKTICPYCGVGCGIYLGVRGNKIIDVRGDPDNNINQGRLCVKGRYGFNFINHPKRLTKPLIKREGKFEEVEWDEALDFIVENLSKYRYGNKNSFAAISSAKCTNEENYLLQKFTRAVMGTNNIDHCARLCHATSVAGLSKTLGSGAMSNSIEEIADTDCIFAIGTNTTDAHPIIGMQVVKSVKKGAKLIVANPREIDLCKHADLFLQQNPGTDVALLMGIMKVIVDEGLQNNDFIEERCRGYQEFKESLLNFDLDFVEKITGVGKEKIRKAARLYSDSDSSNIIYAMGITQHSHGTDNVMAVSNLALLNGNIGKINTGVNPLRGQNNVQGSCDMGALPDVYPGYQSVSDQKNSRKFQREWNCQLNTKIGLTLPEIFDAALNGEIKSIYIMGENPILSEPDSSKVKSSLENLQFLVVQDIFLTETAELADVVLPASSFAEKDGTFTNTERRVQRVRKAIKNIGDSKADWQIICEIAKRLNSAEFNFNSPEEVFQEITSLTPIYGGISYKRLDEAGLQWPCRSADDPGTKFLYEDEFSTIDGKARFMPLEYKPPAEIPDEEYPFILTTGRNLYQYHTGTMSRRIKGLNILNGYELVEIDHQDARELGLQDDDLVYVISRRGKVKARVKLTSRNKRGMVSMTFHFSETPTNLLTNPALDPVASTPELKVCAVSIKRI